MITQTLWVLIAIQISMGTFDMLYHHELTERLAWRPTQRHELLLHGIRNLIYAALFLVLAWLEPHGALAFAVMALLVVEVLVTLADFVEEDVSRKLPASERVLHTLLALNYGAILSLLLPTLAHWGRLDTGIATTWYGWWSVFGTLASVGVVPFGLRDLLAMRRVGRLRADPAEALIADLGRQGMAPGRRVLVTGASGFIGRRLCAALAASGHEVIALLRNPAKADGLMAPYRLITRVDQIADDTKIDAIVNLAGAPIAGNGADPCHQRGVLARACPRAAPPRAPAGPRRAAALARRRSRQRAAARWPAGGAGEGVGGGLRVPAPDAGGNARWFARKPPLGGCDGAKPALYKPTRRERPDLREATR